MKVQQNAKQLQRLLHEMRTIQLAYHKRNMPEHVGADFDKKAAEARELQTALDRAKREPWSSW